MKTTDGNRRKACSHFFIFLQMLVYEREILYLCSQNEYMMKKKYLWMIVAILTCSLSMAAQNDPVFKLAKENGHFYFRTSVNSVRAKLMFESGVPGFMMGDAFYEAHKDSLKMDVKPCNEKIRYLGGLHNVKQSATRARLRIGDAVFEGPVKIVEGDASLKFPIQMIHHASDSSNIVWVDLKKSEFSVISRTRLQSLIKKATMMELGFNKWGMPTVRTTLTLKVDGRQTSIEGDFIADMGNASLLFLNNSQPNVVKMLEDGWIELKDARTKDSKVFTEAFNADKITICDRKFRGSTVGVNPFKSMDEYGILGVKFFNIPTIFDFGDKKLYLCK